MNYVNNNFLRKNIIKAAKANNIPISGSLEITSKCNFNCIHCYLPKTYIYELSKEECFNYIDQIYEHGCKFLTITGGEILLHPFFKEIYVRAFNKGLIIDLYTNGSLITDDIVELLCKYPPKCIEISIYGSNADMYEKITGCGNNYYNTIDSVKLLLNNNLPVVLKSIILKENKSDFYNIKNVFESLNMFFMFSFNILPRINGDKSNLIHRLSIKEALELELSDGRNRIEDWNKKLQMDNKFKKTPYLFICGGGRNSFKINCDSTLSMCHFLTNTKQSLKEKTFRDIWDSYSEYRNKKYSSNFKCKDCLVSNLCDLCPEMVYLENNDLSFESTIRYQCNLAQARKEAVISKLGHY